MAGAIHKRNPSLSREFFKSASALKLIRSNRIERIEHGNHITSGGRCMFRCNFTSQAKISQRCRSGRQRIAVHGQKCPDNGRSCATGAGDRPHQRMAVSHLDDPASVSCKIRGTGNGQHSPQFPGQGSGGVCGIIYGMDGVDPLGGRRLILKG